MTSWMNLGQQFAMNAIQFPYSMALKDKNRSFTYYETNERVNRLASSLADIGLIKGDKVAVLMENCVELVELYLATAKTGIVLVPVNFRLFAEGVSYVVDNSDAKVVCFSHEFLNCINEAKPLMSKVSNYIAIGENAPNYIAYEVFLNNGRNVEPDVDVESGDTWIIIYTSGTTGKPKGVVRSHESHIAFLFDKCY